MELLLLCRRQFPQALDFLMLGRQWLRMQPDEALHIQQSYDVKATDLADAAMTDSVYAEALLQRMNLRSITSLDATAYQGAELIHDLNTPLPETHYGQYDYVVDGGSLEHVFDFPAAIRNCSALLRTGGLFITICPVNNWMGHGFYQFSPELFFRVFDAENGYRVRFAVLHVRDVNEQMFVIRDPASIGHRVQHNPPGRMSLMFVAEKLRADATLPAVQQSDYSERWDKGDKHDRPESKSKGLKTLIPNFIRQPISVWRIRRARAKKNRTGLIPCQTLAEAWKHWQEDGR